MGYVLKDCAATDIRDCIKSVEEGEPYISPTLTKYLIKKAGQRNIQAKEIHGVTLLTETERLVLKLISEGKQTKTIARELFVSPKTIENHRSSICSKLNVHGTNALFRFALEHKLIL
ncbi:MAG: response regulator transcription factor [Ignavibacteriae bacterium]|nr:response regulator transcription factor [Ignavibacteriota bacterium]